MVGADPTNDERAELYRQALVGKRIHLALRRRVPLGLIVTAYSATPIEVWQPAESMRDCHPLLQKPGERHRAQLPVRSCRLRLPALLCGEPPCTLVGGGASSAPHARSSAAAPPLSFRLRLRGDMSKSSAKTSAANARRNRTTSNASSAGVNPNEEELKKCAKLNIDYFQLYGNYNNELIAKIKDKYSKKIISAIQVKKQEDVTPYDDIVSWFFNHSEGFELLDGLRDKEYKALLDAVSPLDDLLAEHQPKLTKQESYFVKEFVLWALVEYKQLSKYRFTEGIQFKDPYGSFISGL